MEVGPGFGTFAALATASGAFERVVGVEPTPQMAERFQAGEAIGVGPFDFTPPNRHVDE